MFAASKRHNKTASQRGKGCPDRVLSRNGGCPKTASQTIAYFQHCHCSTACTDNNVCWFGFPVFPHRFAAVSANLSARLASMVHYRRYLSRCCCRDYNSVASDYSKTIPFIQNPKRAEATVKRAIKNHLKN
jgi:hypothetical protein